MNVWLHKENYSLCAATTYQYKILLENLVPASLLIKKIGEWEWKSATINNTTMYPLPLFNRTKTTLWKKLENSRKITNTLGKNEGKNLALRRSSTGCVCFRQSSHCEFRLVSYSRLQQFLNGPNMCTSYMIYLRNPTVALIFWCKIKIISNSCHGLNLSWNFLYIFYQ